MNFLKGIEVFIILMAVSACHPCSISGCPEPIMYSREFQTNLVQDMEKLNSYYINQAIMDLFNINQKLKECKKNTYGL